MVDENKIKSQYEILQKRKHQGLLPLEKVIELEKAKYTLLDKYFNKILALDKDFEIISNEKFSLNDIIKELTYYFGSLNFIDKKVENEKISIDMAFNFCIVTISYQNKIVKSKINVFWDL